MATSVNTNITNAVKSPVKPPTTAAKPTAVPAAKTTTNPATTAPQPKNVAAPKVALPTPTTPIIANPATIVNVEKPKTNPLGLYNQNGAIEKKTSSAISDKSTSSDSGPSNSTGLIAGSGDVIVDIKNSDSGYENKIYWSDDNFKTRHYLGVDNQTGSFNIGKFAEGTRIDFGIDNGAGQFFRTGTAANNADNIEHAQFSKTSDGTQIGFEDLFGGGDNDFNDAIINVRNTTNSTPTPQPKVETKVEPKDTKVDPNVQPKVEPKDTKVDLKVLPKVEPKDAKIDPKVQPKVEPKDTKVDLKVLPKIEPKDTKIDPNVQPKVEPKNTKVDLKVLPKVDPKVQPKVEPKVQPKVEPKDTKVDPKVQPKVEPKGTKVDLKSTTTSTNRSGLGDGTNPGQGTINNNSSNNGTNNPNGKISAYINKPVPGAQLKIAV